MIDWQECLQKRTAKEVHDDKDLIISLLKSSKNKQESEKQLKLTEVTAGSKVSLAYDSLRELLEALALQHGYKVYNHECYTPFLKEIMKKSLWGDDFDKLRKIRNSINYYGKEITIKEAETIIQEIIQLKKKINTLIL